MTLGVMKPQQNLLRPPQYFSGIFGDHQQPWNTGNDTKNSFLKDYLSAEAKSLKHKNQLLHYSDYREEQHVSKKEQYTSLFSTLPRKIWPSPKRNGSLSQSPNQQYLNGRLTPVIVEPRISSFEAEDDLTIELKPEQYKLEKLPSFDSFRLILDKTTNSLKSLQHSDPIKSILPRVKSSRTKKNKQSPRKRNAQKDNPQPFGCGCTVKEETSPYYQHLGSAKSFTDLHDKLAAQFNISKEAIKIVKVAPAGVEGKNGDGCPIARWVLRRTNEEEKYLVVAKKCQGHTCEDQVTVVVIVAWEGISQQYADDMYKYLCSNLNKFGFKTRRRCGTNESKTCMCQGEDEETEGASFTFGCSWSIFLDGCKFAKSTSPRKFKMQERAKEEEMEKVLQEMATNVSPLLKIWAPKAYENMTNTESEASDCRIGLQPGRPFSGVTCCLDFCAHSHKDMHNMNNGTTMVCTLLKPDYNERNDEQLHVLPLYQLLDDDGKVAPPNFKLPPHFLQSKIRTTQTQPEGKGRYVSPKAVTMKSNKIEHKLTALDPSDENLLSVCERENEKPIQKDGKVKDSIRSNVNGQELSEDVVFKDDQHIPQIKNDFRDQELGNESADTKKPKFADETSIPRIKDNFKNEIGKEEGFNDFTDTAKPNLTVDSSKGKKQSRNKKTYVSKPSVLSEDMGGVAIALGHGSFLVECAKKEVHATTSLHHPTRNYPSRISMVFYQHKKLNTAKHGYYAHQEKLKQKAEKQREELKQQQCVDDLSENTYFDESINTSYGNVVSAQPSIPELPHNLPPTEQMRKPEKGELYQSFAINNLLHNSKQSYSFEASTFSSTINTFPTSISPSRQFDSMKFPVSSRKREHGKSDQNAKETSSSPKLGKANMNSVNNKLMDPLTLLSNAAKYFDPAEYENEVKKDFSFKGQTPSYDSANKNGVIRFGSCGLVDQTLNSESGSKTNDEVVLSTELSDTCQNFFRLKKTPENRHSNQTTHMTEICNNNMSQNEAIKIISKKPKEKTSLSSKHNQQSLQNLKNQSKPNKPLFSDKHNGAIFKVPPGIEHLNVASDYDTLEAKSRHLDASMNSSLNKEAVLQYHKNIIDGYLASGKRRHSGEIKRRKIHGRRNNFHRQNSEPAITKPLSHQNHFAESFMETQMDIHSALNPLNLKHQPTLLDQHAAMFDKHAVKHNTCNSPLGSPHQLNQMLQSPLLFPNIHRGINPSYSSNSQSNNMYGRSVNILPNTCESNISNGCVNKFQQFPRVNRANINNQAATENPSDIFDNFDLSSSCADSVPNRYNHQVPSKLNIVKQNSEGLQYIQNDVLLGNTQNSLDVAFINGYQNLCGRYNVPPIFPNSHNILPNIIYR